MLGLAINPYQHHYQYNPERPAANFQFERSKVFRKIATITLVALSALCALTSLVLAVVAPIIGIHLLWVGSISLALMAIVSLVLTSCSAKSSRRKDWTYERMPHPICLPLRAPGDHVLHEYNTDLILQKLEAM